MKYFLRDLVEQLSVDYCDVNIRFVRLYAAAYEFRIKLVEAGGFYTEAQLGGANKYYLVNAAFDTPCELKSKVVFLINISNHVGEDMTRAINDMFLKDVLNFLLA
ncbi:hypothetical protein DBR42_25235 [Pelomonas sp. HMWF004]|nr:hypothetical protein DBR42_25235 [Pelomonas sp. HMWF004]